MRFYFDVVSPYAFLAWTQVPGLARAAGVPFEPIPILFAGLLGHHGQLGPAEIPAKRVYVMHDVARKARDLAVALDVPPAHPFNPLLALRVSSVPMPPDRRLAVIDALFRAPWQRCRSIDTREAVTEVLDEAGLPGAELVAAASSDEGKARLRAQTEAAIDAGVFGVPSVFVGEELFWGVDALPHVEAALGGAPPALDPGLAARWADLPAAAQRKR